MESKEAYEQRKEERAKFQKIVSEITESISSLSKKGLIHLANTENIYIGDCNSEMSLIKDKLIHVLSDRKRQAQKKTVIVISEKKETAVLSNNKKVSISEKVKGPNFKYEVKLNNLNPHVTSLELECLIGNFLPRSDFFVRLIQSKVKNESKGFGFVYVWNQENANLIFQNLNGLRWNYTILQVSQLKVYYKKSQDQPERKNHIVSKPVGSLSKQSPPALGA